MNQVPSRAELSMISLNKCRSREAPHERNPNPAIYTCRSRPVAPDAPPISHTSTFSPAGAVRRPPVDTTPFDTQDLAYSLVRVLDESHGAVGPWTPEIETSQLRRGLRAMMKTRSRANTPFLVKDCPSQWGLLSDGVLPSDQVLTMAHTES